MSHRSRLDIAEHSDVTAHRGEDAHHKLLKECAHGTETRHGHKGEHGACKTDSILPSLTISGTDRGGQKALNVDDIVTEKTIAAVMKNEQNNRGLKDPVEDIYSAYISKWPNFDIGPAKMSEKQIAELKRDPKYEKDLQDADPYTEAGAKKLISAYLHREADRFERGDYAKGNDEAFNKDRPGDVKSQVIRGNFNEMQTLWNQARKTNDVDTMRKILEETYNAGKYTDQIKQVESIRLGTAADQIDVSKWRTLPKKPVEEQNLVTNAI
ncbi:MAG TPA: hypothetical protein V6C89_00255 [Drouetiella sp.]|jgi:hypothetical protein